MGNGYWSKLLRVDLTEGAIREEQISEAVFKQFIGGSGLGAKIIFDEVRGSTDPFDPANRLVFAVGPWQAADYWGSGKVSIVSKSPQTMTLADSSGGHKWPIYFKGAGYDALVVQGRAARPVYLWIGDGRAEIRDAEALWGLDTVQTREALQSASPAGAKLACVMIGPAGEKLVRFACIAVDEHGYAGRTGTGAVMGSKNLKAIVVTPSKKCEVFDLEALRGLKREHRDIILKFAADGRQHGTLLGVPSALRTGNLPIKNWNGDTWDDGAAKIGAPHYTEELKVKGSGCMNCPILCKRHITITEPARYAHLQWGPQYESVALLGSACLVDDLKALCLANEVCNRLGMDTISGGACVAFAMECFERGWITAQDTGGLDLSWGNAEAVVELVRRIGLREGLGDVLAEGTVRAAARIGQGAERIVSHVRGLDFPAWDPRAFWGAAVNYATGSIGASHCKGMIVPLEFGAPFPEMGIDGETEQFVANDKARVAARSQDISAIIGSLSMCSFMVDWGGLKNTHLVAALNAITGWDWPVEELVRTGERISALHRLINVRDGRGKAYDALPLRSFEPSRVGPRAGQVPPFARMLADYYEIRGWDDDGLPTAGTLERLGLSECRT